MRIELYPEALVGTAICPGDLRGQVGFNVGAAFTCKDSPRLRRTLPTQPLEVPVDHLDLPDRDALDFFSMNPKTVAKAPLSAL